MGTRKPHALILLVDDNAAKRLALKSVLMPLGHRIVEADSGIAALRCVMAEDFAVILLDVRMPAMDGFETAALIRQRRHSELTPIIFITAYGNDEIANTDRYAEGAVDFIFAPVPPNELRAKVTVFANLFIKAELLAARACEVQASADQLRLLTDAAPIGIFQTDVENRYMYTNPRWTEITGIRPEEAAGQAWDTVIGRKLGVGLVGESDDRAVDQAEIGHRFELQTPGSDTRIVQVTSKAVPDGHGETAGWVGTLADITAEMGVEAAMAEARDAALSANAMQENFAASASNQLRTPMTPILGSVEEVLEKGTLAEEDRRILHVVYRNAQRLSQLIDDLLVPGLGEIGVSSMSVEPTALAPLVERVLSSFSREAQGAGVILVSEHEPELPLAMVDPPRLEQVLANLVENALKFTPGDGEVTVGIRSGDGAVEISVADTGMGIPPGDVERIFGRFYRAANAIDLAVGGTGLGLSIARDMIEAQDGEIRVDSTLGLGSTFTITLPVATREPLPV